jgi:hypothetical protein
MRANSVERSADIAGAPVHGLEDEEAPAILFIGSSTEPKPDLAPPPPRATRGIQEEVDHPPACQRH